MEVLQNGLFLFVGMAGGIVVAGGLFAFLTVVGVVTRLAAGTKTAKYLMLYEDVSVLGLTLGNLADQYKVFLPFGGVLILVFGIGAGVFTGCLAAALAEVVNVFPVMSKRIALKHGFAVLMLVFALGKAAGSLYQLLQ